MRVRNDPATQSGRCQGNHKRAAATKKPKFLRAGPEGSPEDTFARNPPHNTAAYRAARYDGDNALFSVPDSALATIETPMLALRGNDEYHPSSASELVAGSVPGPRLVPRWREPEHLPSARTTIAELLRRWAKLR